MQPADVVLAALEKEQLVAHALFDEHAARVLLDDAFFVLGFVVSPASSEEKGVDLPGKSRPPPSPPPPA